MARKRTPVTLPLERRTLIVWGALVAAMTVVSGVLMLMEPRPLAPSVAGQVLSVLDSGPSDVEAIFDTHPAPGPARWQAIVIHHSGQSFGNAQTLAEQHRAAGRGGLGDHFVIGNGDGAGDGEVQVGYRWTNQLPGAQVHGSVGGHDRWYNQHAVEICLIGNGDDHAPTTAQMQQLVHLVTALQRRLDIPADRVYLMSNITRGSSPGVLFPTAWFRQRLLSVAPTASR